MPTEELTPGDLVGVNKDSYLVLDKLPAEYDSRVRAFEVDERPTEQYTDIGGLDSQIQELVEAIVLPMTEKDRFITMGIKPPKVWIFLDFLKIFFRHVKIFQRVILENFRLSKKICGSFS